MKDNILYLDNHILIAVKKGDLLTQPTDNTNKSLQEECKAFLKEKFNKKGNVFLHPIHRLDKPVSGMVLFARTSKALSRLQKMTREKKVHKEYIALVEGKLEKKKAKLQHFLIKKDYRAIVEEKTQKDAKEAILDFEVVLFHKNTTLIKVILQTGRYHQIRAQFSHIGHPIVGDGKYKSKKNQNTICLHHFKLAFTHPVTKEKMVFTHCPAWALAIQPHLCQTNDQMK